MKPKVDDSCIGCGTCDALCQSVFKVEDVGGKMMAVVQEADYETEKAKIDEAIGACPTQSISWEE